MCAARVRYRSQQRAAQCAPAKLIKDFHRDEAETVFRPSRAFVKQRGIVAEFVSKVGSAADVIATLVNGGAFDLVLMGSHGHGNLANALMESVATKVIATCKVPVLLVRWGRPYTCDLPVIGE